MPARSSKKKKPEDCKFCFKIVRGAHQEHGKKYRANAPNNIIYTDSDLGRKFNRRGSIRFVKQRHGEYDPTQEMNELEEQQTGLEHLSMKELVQVAEDLNVKLPAEDPSLLDRDQVIEMLEPAVKEKMAKDQAEGE